MADILVVSLERNRIIDEQLDNSEVISKFQILADAIIHIVNELFQFQEDEDPSVAWLFIENEVLNYNESLNHLLSIAEDFLVKVIDDVINLVFSEDHVIGVALGEDLVKFVAEIVNFTETNLYPRVMVQWLVNRTQISESVDPNRVFFKVVATEVMNIPENVDRFFQAVGLELKRVISEIVSFAETYDEAFGFVRVVDEAISLFETTFGIAFVIGQVVMQFMSLTAMRMTFWINRDIEK